MSAERILDVMRRANDDLERKMTAELEKALGAQSAVQRELAELRTKNAELQRDLEQATQQKSYVTDAFENSRKEASRLRAENQANEADLQRLRKMVEDLQAERVFDSVARRAVLGDLQQLEVDNDVLGRALGAATKQLFGKQQAAAAAAAAEATPSKGRAAAKKPMRPTAKALRADSPGTSPRHTGSAGGARRVATRG